MPKKHIIKVVTDGPYCHETCPFLEDGKEKEDEPYCTRHMEYLEAQTVLDSLDNCVDQIDRLEECLDEFIDMDDPVDLNRVCEALKDIED